MKEKWILALPFVLMIVLALSMWPGVMPMNFSAAYALAFCAGVYFPPRLRWALPLSVLLVTNLATNWHYEVDLFHPSLVLKLAIFAALIWLGTRYSARSSWLQLLGGGMLSALVFYVVSNSGAWLYDPGYAKTLAGWVQALTVGLPGYPPTWEFFRNTLLSGGLFTGLFAAGMKLTAPEPEEKEKGEEESAPAPEESKA